MFDANASNDIVAAVYDVAGDLRRLRSRNLYDLDDAKARRLNWGIAAVVYFAVGTLIARLLAGSRPRLPSAVGRPSA